MRHNPRATRKQSADDSAYDQAHDNDFDDNECVECDTILELLVMIHDVGGDR